MNYLIKLKMVMPVVLVLALILLPACGDDGNTPTAETAARSTPTEIDEPVDDQAELVTITIGNLTDLTGVSANAMSVIDMALEDLVRYYNQENLIPGVELKVVNYDGQTDPSRDIPGYEWLRQKGADLIHSPVTATASILKPFLEEDNLLLFSESASGEALIPPGYVFAPTAASEDLAYTLLRWVAENDWDYKSNGPAKIGAADWPTDMVDAMYKAMEEYAAVHPDQFEWVGGYQTVVGSFLWDAEIQALKDCDYVVPPILMWNFVKDYRAAGCTGKLLGGDPQAAFMGMIDDARLWDEIDGMFFFKTSRWWNEDGPLIDLAKKLLHEYHPESADEVMRSGSSYLAIDSASQMLEIIANTVETVGAQNFNTQALYDAAVSYSQVINGVERANFSETKRNSLNFGVMYEARAAENDLFRLHEEWYPLVRSP